MERFEAYMLNACNKEKNTVFYSCLACFANTYTLNMYVSIRCLQGVNKGAVCEGTNQLLA